MEGRLTKDQFTRLAAKMARTVAMHAAGLAEADRAYVVESGLSAIADEMRQNGASDDFSAGFTALVRERLNSTPPGGTA